MLSWLHLADLAHAVLAPVQDPTSRTWLPALALSALIALVARCIWRRELPWIALYRGVIATLGALWHRSSGLDLQLLLGRQLLRALGLLPAIAGSWFLATWAVRIVDWGLGAPSIPNVPTWVIAVAYTITLFVVWDASRFLLHLLMHRVPAMWALHQVHHSAEVLTPLTFHRLHPLESLLYQARGLVVTTLVVAPYFWLFRGQLDLYTVVGVHALGFVFSVLSGNLRHSHVWLRYGPHVERWLISPAQHQIHHSADEVECHSNYGTWLAVWDRWCGTLIIAGTAPPARFGLAGPRNHGDDLLSAWFGPLRQLFGRDSTRATMIALTALGLAMGLPTASDAAEPDSSEGDDDDDMTIIVDAQGGVPTVAGSAQVIDEEVLERMEHDDVTRILPTVPGVYVRGEDGYGLRPNIGIRGASSDRSAKITLLEDGVLLAPAPYAAPAAYYFPMSTRLIGMEVFKGPAAIQHGPQTVGGAINMRTRQVPDDGPRAALDTAIGLNQTVKVHGWAGTGGARSGVLAEIVHLGTQGFKDLDGGGSTGFQRTEMMLKARSTQTLGKETRSQVELKLGLSREDSRESYLGLSADDVLSTPYRRYAATALDRMKWQRTQAELSWDVRVGNKLQIRTTAYHHYLTRSWTKFNRFAGGPPGPQILQRPSAGAAAVYMAVLRGEEDSASDEQQLMIGTNDRRYSSAGVQTRARWRVVGDKVSALWETGFRLHMDDVVRLHTEDANRMVSGALQRSDTPTIVNQDRRSTARAMAANTHGDISVGGLHLQPGVRAEWIRTTQQKAGEKRETPQSRLHLLPGMGLLQQIGDVGAVFTGANRGFSPVSPGQLPGTLPEVSWNYELGARFRQGERHAEAALFASDYKNLTGECTSAGGCTSEQVGQQFNAGRVLVAGLESAASDEVPLTPGLTMPIRASYTYTTTRFAEDFSSGFPQFGDVRQGDRLPYVPTHQGTVSAGLDHELFQLTVAAEARSFMLDSAGDERGDFDVPAILLMDVAAKIKVHGPLWTYLTVTNLTGTTAVTSWRPLGARPAAPRQVTLGLKLR